MQVDSLGSYVYWVRLLLVMALERRVGHGVVVTVFEVNSNFSVFSCPTVLTILVYQTGIAAQHPGLGTS